MKKITFIITAIALTAFKGGPAKGLIEETSIKARTISFEAIHNLNVPMVYADGRIVVFSMQTNNHLVEGEPSARIRRRLISMNQNN